ncbi:hypothetical protein [Streptacidiphilus sp. EB129]|uniref:hypothetical protein n=1 Tax=Streptacidiphilus sp. EB129 TaxID=3156262 RepID=UPI0035112BE3
MAEQQPGLLPADHPARPSAALALRFSLATAVVFTVFAYVTTQLHAVRAGSPWQDDPYDAVVSFTLFLVPALAGLTAVRAVLYRRRGPQPVYRVDQLLRAAVLATSLVAATVLTDWAAVAVRADRGLWNDGTPWLITALIPVTAAAVAGLTLERRAFRRLPSTDRHRPDGHRPASHRPDGDWLDDLALAVDALTARLPDPIRRSASLLDSRAAAGFARTHIVALAATASLSAGLALAGGQAVGEGWPGPLLFLIEMSVHAGGFFAFCMLCNAVLRIAVPRSVDGPSPGTPSRRRATRHAITAAALAIPLSGALRDPVRSLIGQGDRTDSATQLAWLVLAGALLTGTLTFAVSIARRRQD